MRIAAVGDLHTSAEDEARIVAAFASVNAEADVLVLAGDLTDHGRPSEAEALMRGLRDVRIPIVAVLGNHDHDAGEPRDVMRMLSASGIHVLDRKRPTTILGAVGFAGVKGFGGGFGPRLVRGFGEDSLKAFVAASVVEAEALRAGLLALDTPSKVAVLHYSPIVATIHNEPPEIWPFLGTSRLEAAVDGGRPAFVVHGHAHHGSAHGTTAGGVPVHNVSLPVLRASGHQRAYAIIPLASGEGGRERERETGALAR